MDPVTIYFITALVSTTFTPSLGWVQANTSYSLLEVCYEHVESKRDAIVAGLHTYFGGRIISVRDIQCLTYDQAVEKNAKLGH